MTTMSTNGRAPRKTLATQLDRLDLILDGLADGLNEAVATAVQEAVSRAVAAALREVLTNAELQKRLRPEPVARSGKIGRAASMLCRGLNSAAQGCWSWAVKMTGRCREKATEIVTVMCESRKTIAEHMRRGMTALARRVWLGGVMVLALASRFRTPLLMALATGTLLGIGCYLAGPTVSSVVSGMAGFAGSLVASGLNRFRRLIAEEDVREWGYRRIV